MKKKDSSARIPIIMGLLFFALIFMAEVYAMINFPKMYVVLGALAVADVICLCMTVNAAIREREEAAARTQEQYESVFKSEKASYLMLKKYFDEVSVNMAYMGESAKIPTEEVVNAQKGIAKVIIKRSHENTEALMNSYEELSQQFEQFQKSLDDITAVMGSYKDEIVSTVSAIDGGTIAPAPAPAVQPRESDDHAQLSKEIEMKLQDIIVAMKDMELRLSQTMSNQKVVVSQPAPQPMMYAQQPVAPAVAPAPVPELQPQMEPTAFTPTPAPEAAAPQPVMEMEPEVQPEENLTPEPEELPPMEDGFASELSEGFEPEPEAVPPMEESLTPDPEWMSQDSFELPPESEREPAEELPVMTADEIIPPDPEEAIEEAEQLVEPEPEPAIVDEPENAPEELPPMPDLSDPNRAMSADEISALFANMGAGNADAPAMEEAVEPEPEPEPVIAEEPQSAPEELPPMPDLSDPNRAMSPDEISALFANMGAGNTDAPAAEEPVEPEPEPVVEPEEPADPNKALSPDEIAALFASMGT